jgi:hypothetical protein
MSTAESANQQDEFVTIIGRDFTEIANEFRAQGLAAQEFSIVHRIGRTRFTRVDGDKSETMFDGEQLIAATFQRRQTT